MTVMRTIFTVPVNMSKILKILSFVEIMILADNNKDAKARFQIMNLFVGPGFQAPLVASWRETFFIGASTRTKRWVDPWLGPATLQLFMFSKTTSS